VSAKGYDGIDLARTTRGKGGERVGYFMIHHDLNSLIPQAWGCGGMDGGPCLFNCMIRDHSSPYHDIL
jgi:hypothetical protein